MKHILALVLSLAFAATIGKAQNFSGTISYKMEIKNMPAGMPQAVIDQMVPSKVTIFVKGDNMATTTNAGPFRRIVMQAGSDTTYMVMDQAKTILAMTKELADDQGKAAKVEKPVITKTNKTETIAGYPCSLYLVETKMGEETIKQELWVTEKIVTPKPKVNAPSTFGQSAYFADVKGAMMRMTSKVMNMDIIIEATEISTTAPSDSEFTLPTGYAHKLFSKEAIMGAMMGK